jgi:class 3 adenylate cyclase
MYNIYLSKYPQLTKIKCIGDCYMAAGGLFDDINQLSVHATQSTCFCLDVLKGLIEFNKVHGCALNIRAGVNTGGPITAGILSAEKPNFDILGPAISMAAQMEHHGVPGRCHVSKYTYEVLDKSLFKISKRGGMIVNNEKILTYIVQYLDS